MNKEYNMGNQPTKQIGGISDTDKVDIQSVISNLGTLQEALDYFLSQKPLEQYQDKTHCKSIKLFLRDEILMNQATEALETRTDLIIGKEDDSEKDHKTICNLLANYYLKKINMFASIHGAIDIGYKKIEQIRSGGQCKGKTITEVSPEPHQINISNNPSIKLTEVFREGKHRLEIDADEIRKLALSKFTADGRGRGFTKEGKLTDVTLSGQADKNLLVRELASKDTCEASSGNWITTEDQLIQERLRPDSKITDYNQTWRRILGELELEVIETSNLLLQKSQEIFTEELVDKDGNQTKTFVDKPTTQGELDNIISEVRNIITELLSNIEAKQLVLINLPIITQSDIDEKHRREDAHRSAGEANQDHETLLNATND
jgi:hypothetical protein